MSMAVRFRSARIQAKREFRSTLTGPGIYVVLSLIFLGVSFGYFRNRLLEVVEQGIIGILNPGQTPWLYAIGLAALYLGVCAAISISRERDVGTLEVLFYGPVDSLSYVMGKYAQQMMAFGVVLVFSLINFYIINSVTNLGMSNVLGMVVLSIFLTSAIISFGILLSAMTRKMTVSIVLFLGLNLFFFAFTTAHLFLQSLSALGVELAPVFVFIRSLLDNTNFIVEWISPLSYFLRGSRALSMGDTGQYILSLLSSTIYTLVALALSVAAFNWKGVRP